MTIVRPENYKLKVVLIVNYELIISNYFIKFLYLIKY